MKTQKVKPSLEATFKPYPNPREPLFVNHLVETQQHIHLFTYSTTIYMADSVLALGIQKQEMKSPLS